ncbi:MAG: hypothetical protein IK080_04275 [Clostridia bacterium]|nr:hypothetical protein [Clostridia bacterium]
MKSLLCVVLSWLITTSFSWFASDDPRTLQVNPYVQYQTFEGFGTSSCWWAQTIDSDEEAKEIARLLYDDETGLGLDIFRYNIGGGEADNPATRIWDRTRRTESFYVYDAETGAGAYDFTRDANARRVLDYAVEYGAKEVILFCNSPHYSMTVSGQASGGLTPGASNLPPENYGAFVDYVLTIADWFVAQGYPVTAISPINEPQWDWGGDWVGQEGCHYSPEETVTVLELFATEMQRRGSPYALRGPESGQLTWHYYDYIDKFFESEILSGFCDTYSAHSYWMDGDYAGKQNFAWKMETDFPGKKFEMSEWCELPMRLDSRTIDSGLYMANILVQDLTVMNAVSWQSWTAVNGDGVLDRVNGELVQYRRYDVYKQFSAFIQPGMQRVQVLDTAPYAWDETDRPLVYAAFSGGGKTVLIVVNNSEEAQPLRLRGVYARMQTVLTDETHHCEPVYHGLFRANQTLPARSVTTFVLR